MEAWFAVLFVLHDVVHLSEPLLVLLCNNYENVLWFVAECDATAKLYWPWSSTVMPHSAAHAWAFTLAASFSLSARICCACLIMYSGWAASPKIFILAWCYYWRNRHLSLVHYGLALSVNRGKWSCMASYPTYSLTYPKWSRYFSAFWASKPATIPIVVGSEAAHTPSRLAYGKPVATTNGGTHS